MEMSDRQKEIENLCKQLKLSAGMAERAMVITGETNQEYLIKLFDSEINARRQKRIADKFRKADLPYTENIDEMDISEIVFPQELSFEQCMDLKFIRERRNLLMYGYTGTGKTMLSICLAIKACTSDLPVRFFETSTLITKLKEALNAGRLTSFKAKLYESQIFILDEFGYTPYDLTGAQLLFEFISEIYKKKILILNTNKTFSEWEEIFIDPKMTKAMIGRITEHCHLILFPGEDWRFKKSNFAKMFESMKLEDLSNERAL